MINMISIIICFIDPVKLEKTIKSIEMSIDCKYEFIIHDNRNNPKGICQVYNECASKASGEYLCFVHEDVLFNTHSWGNKLIEFAQKTNHCGVIGFGGSGFVSKYYISWFCGFFLGKNMAGVQGNYILPDAENSKKYIKTIINPFNEEFAQVITLDGYFLFCKKEVWENIKFDSVNFNGFHFYDQDFTFACFLKGYKNYVCHKIETIHLSRGNYGVEYYSNAKTFRNKYRLKKSISLKKMSLLEKFVCEITDVRQLLAFGNRIKYSNNQIRNDLSLANRSTYIFYYYVAILLNTISMYKKIIQK